MHEMGLVHPLVDAVVDYATKEGTKAVKSVYVTIGDGRDVIEYLFLGLFTHVAKGTVAEKAELVIEHAPFMVKCNQCGQEFEVNKFKRASWACPRCEAVRDCKIMTGVEFLINRIEIQLGDEHSLAQT